MVMIELWKGSVHPKACYDFICSCPDRRVARLQCQYRVKYDSSGKCILLRGIMVIRTHEKHVSLFFHWPYVVAITIYTRNRAIGAYVFRGAICFCTAIKLERLTPFPLPSCRTIACQTVTN